MKVNPVKFYTVQGWRVTSPFGWRIHPISGMRSHHNGIDFGDKPHGHPVQTPYPGVVIAAQFYASRGNTVVLKIAPDVHQLCQHLSAFKCKAGDKVDAGDVIGLNGSTGDSTGAHLHYELRTAGNPWGTVWGDPAKFELEVLELKIAIVANSEADVPAIWPLAKKLKARIYVRGATDHMNENTVIVAGGEGKCYEKPGVKVICLSGNDRWLTAGNVGEYYRGL